MDPFGFTPVLISFKRQKTSKCGKYVAEAKKESPKT
jgi:hypothetical protein